MIEDKETRLPEGAAHAGQIADSDVHSTSLESSLVARPEQRAGGESLFAACLFARLARSVIREGNDHASNREETFRFDNAARGIPGMRPRDLRMRASGFYLKPPANFEPAGAETKTAFAEGREGKTSLAFLE